MAYEMVYSRHYPKPVIPAKAGIYTLIITLCELRWKEVSDNV